MLVALAKAAAAMCSRTPIAFSWVPWGSGRCWVKVATIWMVASSWEERASLPSLISMQAGVSRPEGSMVAPAAALRLPLPRVLRWRKALANRVQLVLFGW